MSMRPPRLAEWLAGRTLRGSERDVVLGDLAEGYVKRTMRSGAAAARRWYWRQTLSSTIPNLRRRMGGRRPRGRRQDALSLDALALDLRYAARMLWRRPAMLVTGVASLGLGIALCTVVFSLFNAVVLRPLGVSDPDGLALIRELRSTGLNHTLPYPDYADYRAAQRSFMDLAAYAVRDVNVGHGDRTRVVRAEMVSGSYFDVAGARMSAGRPLTAADDRVGAPPTAVVSAAFWRELTGREPDDFVPVTLVVNTQRFDVVGVVAPPFRGMQLGHDVRVWFPLHAESVVDPTAERLRASRGSSWLSVFGRLSPGVTRDAAAADLNRLEAALAPGVGRAQPRTYTVLPGAQGDSSLPASIGPPLRVLLLAAMLVVVIASANVANLLVARGVDRTREMAVRSALGASRVRLARPMLLEALLIGLCGAVLALVATPGLAARLVPFMANFGEPVTLDVPVDWRVLVFSTALAVVTALAAGLAPALATLGHVPAQTINDASRGSTSSRTARRVRHALIVAQFAVSLALVFVAALLTRTVYNLQRVPTGLDIDHVALLSVDPDAAQYDTTEVQSYLDRALARLHAVPGVRAAAFSRVPPLAFGGSRMAVAVPGYEPRENEDMELNFDRVTPGYAAAVGLDLVAGRWIDGSDTPQSRPVVVVNETMAHRFWEGGGAVGHSIRFGMPQREAEVVGVVRDVKYRMLREHPRPSFYRRLAQMPTPAGVFHVRTAGDPALALVALRRALEQTDPAVPVTSARTLREQAVINVTDERLAMMIGLVLGATALVLATVGLYGSVSHVVGQRAREIGVRVALGATSGDVRHFVLRQGVRLALIGTSCGAALALALGRLVEGRLYGVSAMDLPTLGAGAALLTAVALLASDVPARRATRITPVEALREQ